MVQGVITGIGFIGAGVILHPSAPAEPVRPSPAADAAAAGQSTPPNRPRRLHEVRGLTTAATVWLAAVLGLASGVGAWALVLLGTALTLAILVAGGLVEDTVRRRLLARLRHRRATLQHDHRTRDKVRVRERNVHPHDA